MRRIIVAIYKLFVFSFGSFSFGVMWAGFPWFFSFIKLNDFWLGVVFSSPINKWGSLMVLGILLGFSISISVIILFKIFNIFLGEKCKMLFNRFLLVLSYVFFMLILVLVLCDFMNLLPGEYFQTGRYELAKPVLGASILAVLFNIMVVAVYIIFKKILKIMRALVK